MVQSKAQCALCERPVLARQWCSRHYEEQRKLHAEEWAREREAAKAARQARVCKIDDCTKPVAQRGWCGMHYQRWRIHGDPFKVHQAPADCIKCGAIKSLRSDGHPYCKVCASRMERERRQRDSEAIRAKQRAKYQRTREQHLAKCREWRAANKERADASVKAWQERNPELRRQYSRTWAARNPDKLRESNHRRRARMLDAICQHGPKCVGGALIRSVRSQMCVYCGAPGEHADHYIPLTRGGLHCKTNIVPACERCNRSKGNRLPSEWQVPAPK